jgi:ABC-type dipeptide/oligopeptide/nickel transport system permease component
LRRYILRRVAAMLATLLFVSVLVFLVVRVLPGDPALVMLGLEASPDTVARLRASMGLDRPLPVQYVEWIGDALRGNLGRSIQYDVPVTGLVLSRLSVTLPLTLMAAALMTLAGVPLGVYAAIRHRGWGDYLTMILSQVGIAVPAFWAGPPSRPPLLGAPGLVRLRRLRRVGAGGGWRRQIAPVARGGPRPLPVRGARAHHALRCARGASARSM